MDNFTKILIAIISVAVVLVVGGFSAYLIKDELIGNTTTETLTEFVPEISFVNDTTIYQQTVYQDISQVITETQTDLTELTETNTTVLATVTQETTVIFIDNQTTTQIDGRDAIIVTVPPTTSPTTETEPVFTYPQATAFEPVTDENGKININTADKQSLMSLPGIGEVKSQAIIDYRNENGNFETIEDITKVSGIGEKTFEKIKDLISV
ncbi:MAG TPA: ComEA family DNA-binding protein [Clostridiales bacterium]|nr:ComEA family DNA-binding protein [Clostridiales bacterium]